MVQINRTKEIIGETFVYGEFHICHELLPIWYGKVSSVGTCNKRMVTVRHKLQAFIFSSSYCNYVHCKEVSH